MLEYLDPVVPTFATKGVLAPEPINISSGFALETSSYTEVVPPISVTVTLTGVRLGVEICKY